MGMLQLDIQAQTSRTPKEIDCANGVDLESDVQTETGTEKVAEA